MLPPQCAARISVGLLFFSCVPSVNGCDEEKPNQTQTVTAAHQYAPALWLAQDEPFYPMSPHPFAFDTIDNDDDGKIDLADEDEIAASGRAELEDKARSRKHLEGLRAVFGSLLDIRTCIEAGEPLKSPEKCDAKDPEGCICYEVERRGEAAKRLEDERLRQTSGATTAHSQEGTVVLDSFRTCGQRWGAGPIHCGPDPVVLYDAADGSRDLSQLDRGRVAEAEAGLRGIQYWMHYPWDAGHINDGEHVSVFFSSRAGRGSSGVRAVVGAGHLGDTANNILVARQYTTEATVPPRRLTRHMPVLVELGKHASAPDFNCNGRFDVGVDANVGPQGAWGSRDAMVSTNSRDIGRFQAWMSFERGGSGFLIEESALHRRSAKEKAESAEWRRGCPDGTHGRAILNTILAEGSVPQGSHEDAQYVAVAAHRYRLISVQAFRDLYCVLQGGEWIGDQCDRPDRIPQELNGASVTRILEEHKREFWGEGREPESIVFREDCSQLAESSLKTLCLSQAAVAGMQKWLYYPRSGRGRRDLWAHADFGRFDNDFKRNLFKQIGVGLSVLVEGGNPKFGLVGRVSGFGFLRGKLLDSSVDLGTYFDGLGDPVLRRQREEQQRLSDISLTYNRYRTSYSGVYVGATWNRRFPDYSAAGLLVRGQDSQPVIIRRRLSGGLSAHFGIAVGKALGPLRGTLRVGAHGPITRGTVRTGNAHSTRHPAGLHVAFDVVYGFRNEKHPLER